MATRLQAATRRSDRRSRPTAAGCDRSHLDGGGVSTPAGVVRSSDRARARVGGRRRLGAVRCMVDSSRTADDLARGLVYHHQHGGRHLCRPRVADALVDARCAARVRCRVRSRPGRDARARPSMPHTSAPTASWRWSSGAASTVSSPCSRCCWELPSAQELRGPSIPPAWPPTRRVGVIGRRAVAVISALGLVALTGFLVQPARTNRITDADGNVVPGSIAPNSTRSRSTGTISRS